MSAKTKESDSGTNAGRLPPRERIIAVASALFYERGIRAVGVEEIASAAETNKMTLYRHFASKDVLVAESLRQSPGQTHASANEPAAAHRVDPRGELTAWLAHMSEHVTASDE